MKKILVIRLSSIGDIVLTTPVIRCLKEQIPGVSIHYAVKRQFLPVVADNPNIDAVHVFHGDLNSFVRELKQEHFDYVVDLHQNFRSRIIRLRLRKRSAGFPKLNFRKWMLTRFKINFMPDVHVVERYFRAARRLGIRNDGQGLEYYIPAGEEYDSGLLPEDFSNGFVAFVIGARHATKRLPEHKAVEICRALQRPVVLLGGPEDAERGSAIATVCGARVINCCGKLTLNQSASLVKQADAVITHDTGLMHIAAAFQKKTITIWGNTVPAFGMAPYIPEHPENSIITEVNGLSCRPCSKLGYDACPKKHFRCMEEVEAAQVAEAVRGR